jgi:hypothetical protein
MMITSFHAQNTMAMVGQPDATFMLYPNLTPVQARAFQLLDVAREYVASKPIAKIPTRESDQALASRQKGNFGLVRGPETGLKRIGERSVRRIIGRFRFQDLVKSNKNERLDAQESG